MLDLKFKTALFIFFILFFTCLIKVRADDNSYKLNEEKVNYIIDFTNNPFAAKDSLLEIRGRVLSKQEPPEPLPGVVVRVKESTSGTVTDEDGYFTIEATIGQTIVFSLVGYEEKEQIIHRDYKSLTISLSQNVSSLDEVQVVGMSEMKRKHIASSLESLPISTNIEGKPITSLSQALQGGITGLQVNQSSGLPGGNSASLKIRGLTTLGNTNPLVLVDGIPMEFEYLNPNTVKDITVLKDAAAAAIYGARAANGVILITTKRGDPGKVSVTYDGYYGFQTPGIYPEFVDAPTYMKMYNIAEINAGGNPIFSDIEIQKTMKGDDPINFPNTDWAKETLKHKTPITNHSIAVSGGNSLARFAVTMEYMSQGGLMPNLNEKRYNLRANTSITLSDKLYFYLDAHAIKRDNVYPNRTLGNRGIRILDDMYRLPPNILPKYPKEEGWPTIYGRYADIVNPVAYFEQGGQINQDFTHSSINIQPRWEVLPGLNLKGQFSFRLESDVNKSVRDNFYFFDYYTKELAQTWAVQRSAASSRRDTYYYLSGTADYSWHIDKHDFFVLVGYSQENFHNGYWDISTLASQFGKLNYSFNDIYLLEASVRRDGSSKFGPGHKFGYFPSVAVGWNVSNETFLSEVSVLNNFKLRASYGQLGNEDVGLYQYQNLINPANGSESVWGNPDLTWETVDILDLGADISLFEQNPLNIVFDYYHKKTNGIILKPPVSLVGAVGSAPMNSGRVQNKGWELSANYNFILSDDLSIYIRGGVTNNKNKILSLKGGPYISADIIQSEGHSIGSYYGYKSDGLLQFSDFDKRGEALVPVTPGQAPGDIKYMDLNGNGIIDEDDKTIIGKPDANVDYFGNLSIRFKGFELETLLQGTGGRDFSANLHGAASGYLFLPLNFSASGGVPTTFYAANAWQPNKTSALFPRINTQPTSSSMDSDFWIWNGDYLRVKFIQLSYNFKIPYLERIGIKTLKSYFNAQNPFVATSIHLADPESAGGSWTYGILKTYTLGVRIEL